MDEPVRRKPDYNEQEFSVDKRQERELNRVVSHFIQDWRAGILRPLPLPQAEFQDCIVEYGAGMYLIDSNFMKAVAERTNRQATLIMHQKTAARQNSLPVILAGAFGHAVRQGRLPQQEYYTRAQAESFLRGALGTADRTMEILNDFVVAHNLSNEDLGLMEVEAQTTIVISVGELTRS